MSSSQAGGRLPPALEEMISEAVAREMKRRQDNRTILEFLISNDGMRLPDGVDLLLEELRGSSTTIRGPRCSICGRNTGEDIKICEKCGKGLCEKCMALSCECETAQGSSTWKHLRDALWMTTGLVGSGSPWMGLLYLLSQDSVAGLYLGASMLALIVSVVHNRGLPLTCILREVTLQGS